MRGLTRLRLARTLLFLACGLLLWTVVRAARLTPVPVTDSAGLSLTAQVDDNQRAIVPLESALAAVDRDPFHADRRRPARRFTLPVPEEEETGTNGQVSGARPTLRLIGTAIQGDGGFAMCQYGSGPARIVRVGDTIGGLRLNGVSRGSARFIDDQGESVDLSVASGERE